MSLRGPKKKLSRKKLVFYPLVYKFFSARGSSGEKKMNRRKIGVQKRKFLKLGSKGGGRGHTPSPPPTYILGKGGSGREGKGPLPPPPSLWTFAWFLVPVDPRAEPGTAPLDVAEEAVELVAEAHVQLREVVDRQRGGRGGGAGATRLDGRRGLRTGPLPWMGRTKRRVAGLIGGAG